MARKRLDVRTRPSVFNSRPRHAAALQQVIDTLDVRLLVVSFSNEGWLTRDALAQMLAGRGDVLVLAHDTKRYVGAQIGIHDPQGRKVGRVSHLRNTEYLFVAGAPHDVDAVRRATDASPRAISRPATPGASPATPTT